MFGSNTCLSFMIHMMMRYPVLIVILLSAGLLRMDNGLVHSLVDYPIRNYSTYYPVPDYDLAVNHKLEAYLRNMFNVAKPDNFRIEQQPAEYCLSCNIRGQRVSIPFPIQNPSPPLPAIRLEIRQTRVKQRITITAINYPTKSAVFPAGLPKKEDE